MGIKIELELHNLAEAALLDTVLLQAADRRRQMAKLRHATPEETKTNNHEADIIMMLRERMNGR